MVIAFDFDNTITAAPREMIASMRLFREAGHTVLCATLRRESEYESVDRVLRGEFPVVYCDRKTKYGVCLEKGFRVDVWVDDMPEFCRNTKLFNVKDEDL